MQVHALLTGIHVSGLLGPQGHRTCMEHLSQHHFTWKIWEGGDYIKYTYSKIKGNVRVEFMVKQSEKNTGFEAEQKS